eukprot:2446964-Prymnesium_polylepis.1
MFNTIVVANHVRPCTKELASDAFTREDVENIKVRRTAALCAIALALTSHAATVSLGVTGCGVPCAPQAFSKRDDI